MKTVSGTVVSSKPVSLSKAARILSKFVGSDNCASPSYLAYLKRASESFDELVQVHKELKVTGGSELKGKKTKTKLNASSSAVINEEIVSPVDTKEDGFLADESSKRGEKESKRSDGVVNGQVEEKKKKKGKDETGRHRNGDDENRISASVNNQVKSEPNEGSGKGKKHKREQRHQVAEVKVEIKEENAKESRKRKHDGSVEKPKSKKSKKTAAK